MNSLNPINSDLATFTSLVDCGEEINLSEEIRLLVCVKSALSYLPVAALVSIFDRLGTAGVLEAMGR